jgi:hypothetical protein
LPVAGRQLKLSVKGFGAIFQAMKSALVLLFVASSLVLVIGCAEDSSMKTGDRLGVRGGVIVASQDMSRVVPTRQELSPPN